jgi:hypothetical protein
MAINQLKVVISLLREFSDGNMPTAADYGIEKEAFWDILDAMQDDGLIKGVRFSRGKGNRIIMAFLENVKVTIKGMEYLNENSALAKTYKGLKEIREWLPF